MFPFPFDLRLEESFYTNFQIILLENFFFIQRNKKGKKNFRIFETNICIPICKVYSFNIIRFTTFMFAFQLRLQIISLPLFFTSKQHE